MAFSSRSVAFVLPALLVSMLILESAQAAPPKDAAAVEFFENDEA